jgi:hypothetical protein
MEAAARESARAGNGWEIVDLGPRAWEVVALDAPRREKEERHESGAEDEAAREPDPPPGPDLARLERMEERLAAVERRARALGPAERRLGALEGAHRGLERCVEERDAQLREELEEIYRQAERRVAATRAEGKRGWRQRRHELKLARQESHRTVRSAERRLADRAEASLDRIEREALASEDRVRGAAAEAQFGLDSAGADASIQLQRRMFEVFDNENRLIDLMDRIGAAEERLRSADERAVSARHRMGGPEGAFEL